ncbi:MAG: GNAT family N-acetyltransferase [Candidatus Limnocylindrales bacterium]
MAGRIRDGWSIAAAAFAEDGPVAFGIHQPVDDVSEIVGVATLPAYRRQGLGAAVTSELVRDALARGVKTTFLSAGSEDVARVYERIGFRRVGSAGGAEPPEPWLAYPSSNALLLTDSRVAAVRQVVRGPQRLPVRGSARGPVRLRRGCESAALVTISAG